MATRDQLVAAAERVMRAQGLARSTTKEIAREAGFAEGTLYKHFESKEALFLAVLTERLPSFVRLTQTLPGQVGRGSIRDVLLEVAGTALAFYAAGAPLSASLFAEPALLARHRDEVLRRGAGPQKAIEAVAAYLDAERRGGRLRADADPVATAALLLGACFQRAYLRHFLRQDDVAPAEERFVAGLVDTLLRGLAPTAAIAPADADPPLPATPERQPHPPAAAGNERDRPEHPAPRGAQAATRSPQSTR